MRGATASQQAARRRWLAAVWLLILGCVFVLVAGSGTAAAVDTGGQYQTNNSTLDNDTTAPEWGPGVKDEATEINVTFYDNGSIDQTSITADDFELSTGNVTNVSSIETFDHDNSSGVYVHLLLADRVNVNNVTVSFTENGSIADSAGNERTDGSTTVSGMDTVVPDDESFELNRVNASTVEVQVETDERLSGININVVGPVHETLSRANFTESVDGTATYTATYTAPEEGDYMFVWTRATDLYGNFLRLEETRSYEYDDGYPDVVLNGPTETTVGTTVNFSAAESDDDDGIESYQWRIDGGTILTGPSIDIAFAVAGTHEVVVEVTDTTGNTTVASQQVQVAPSNDSAVTLSQANATYATASVNGTGYLQQVRATSGPVVESGNVSLNRVSATFPSESTVDMTLTASDTSPSSFGATGLGLFEITHGNVTAEDVTFRFEVNRSALNRTGATPDDVSLYRNDSGWTALDTSIVNRGDARVEYQASSPGLSQFAVGVTTLEETDSQNVPTENETTESDEETTEEGNETTDTSDDNSSAEPTGYPDIVVTNVTVNETSPSVGENVSINVTAENRGTQAGNYSVAVVVNNTTLATNEMEIEPGATETETFVHQMPEAGALEVDGQRVGNVTSSGGLFSFLPGPLASILSAIPNPLALWPDGIVGTILGGVIGLMVAVYAILKALAIYLGY